MNYYIDSEHFKQLAVTIWTDDAGNKGAIFTPDELRAFFDSLTEEDHLITKNGTQYDFIMWEHWLDYDGPIDKFPAAMRKVNDDIILHGKHRKYVVLQDEHIKAKYKFRHTDIQELLNMYCNLKRAAASLGYPEIKETSIHFAYPGEFTEAMVQEVLEYGWSDCRKTEFIFKLPDTITEMMSRDIMSKEFGVDVTGLGRPRAMSKIIDELFERQTGRKAYQAKKDIYRPARFYHFGKILRDIGDDSRQKFDDEGLKEFNRKLLQFKRTPYAGSLPTASAVKAAHYIETGTETVEYDKDGDLRRKKIKIYQVASYDHQFAALKGKKLDVLVTIAGKVYRFKEGGIHSEHDDRPQMFSDDTHQLFDIDFSAFYPGLLLKYNIFPEWMAEAGFDVKAIYKDIVDKNLAEKAKPNGDKMLRYVYKIISNLFYGKYGEENNPLGDGRLQLKTCLTGQLIILRMIERMEAAGISCVYANTDGIVVSCHRGFVDKMKRILKQFSDGLGIGIDPVKVNAMYLDNCNSYLWEMGDGKIKTKKEYTKKVAIENPTVKYPIVKDAVAKFLIEGIPVEDTIYACKDITQFYQIATASSVAMNVRVDDLTQADRDRIKLMVKGLIDLVPEYELEQKLEKLPKFTVLNKNLTYYQATEEAGYSVYKLFHSGTSRGKLVRANHAECIKVCLEVPDEMPTDVNYQYYIDQANERIGNWVPVPRLENIFQD